MPANTEYVHPTLAEYFAGVELARDQSRLSEVLSDPFRPELREVIVFACGELGLVRADDQRLNELVKGILTRSHSAGRYHARHPRLLASILDEEPGLSPRLMIGLAERLARFWFESAFGRSAGLQVQHDALDLLLRCVDRPAGQVLGTALRRFFTPAPKGVRWERLVQCASIRAPDPHRLPARRQPPQGSPVLLLRITDVLTAYGIDPGPTRRHLRAQRDPWLQRASTWGLPLGTRDPPDPTAPRQVPAAE